MGADAFEDVTQVGERNDGESFARGDEAGQHRRRPPAVVAPIEHPVFPTLDRFGSSVFEQCRSIPLGVP